MEIPPLDPNTPRVIGIETEYATHPFVPANREFLSNVLRASDESNTGQFGSWGGRIYVDRGGLIEVATPESFTVRGLLAAHFAGERIAAQAAIHMHPDAVLYKRTIDSAGRTRSDHENYYMTGNKRDHEEKVTMLAAHLATRGVITGPGMLRRQSRRRPDQFSFLLDQRQLDMRHEGSVTDATSSIAGEKPFALERYESFDNEHRSSRLQIVCGSQNMMAFPIAARFFVTSALLRLVEHNVYPQELRYTNPYEAVHATGGVHGLTKRVELTDGRSFTAPEMQLALSEAILQFSDRHAIPPDERAIVEKNYELAEDLMKGDYAHHTDYIEWVAKQHRLDANLARRNKTRYDADSAMLDIRWHSLASNAIAARLRARGRVALMPSDEDLDQASRFPIDPTRAQKRSAMQSAIVKRGEYLRSVNWDHVKSSTDKSPVAINDAYDYRYEEPA